MCILNITALLAGQIVGFALFWFVSKPLLDKYKKRRWEKMLNKLREK